MTDTEASTSGVETSVELATKPRRSGRIRNQLTRFENEVLLLL